MNTRSRSQAFVTVAVFALGLLAACAPQAKPTTKPAATVVPTLKPVATVAAKPTVAPTKAAPTTPPKPTVAPTKVPTKAPTVAPTPAPTTVPALDLGKPGTVGTLLITPTADAKPSLGSAKPEAGNVFLAFTVTITNTSKTDSIVFDPAMLTVGSATDVKVYPFLTLKTAKDELAKQTLKPGAKVTGVVVFQVPEKHSGFDLMYKNETTEVKWSLGA